MSNYTLYEHAGKVPYQQWKDSGIVVPIFDKDGTLSHASKLDFVDDVIDDLTEAQLPDIYPNIAIASNNHDHDAVQNFADSLHKRLGIEVLAVSRAEGYKSKPDPEMGLVIAHKFGAENHELGVIGDRLLTDVTFGRNIGAGAIALCTKAGEGDARWVPTLRVIERCMVAVDQARHVATRYVSSTDHSNEVVEDRPQNIGKNLFDAIQRVQKTKRDK